MMKETTRQGKHRVLVTGANGFVGKALCGELNAHNFAVRAAVRSASLPVENAEMARVGAIEGESDWNEALRDVDVVIHLAARVHVMSDDASDPLAEFRKVNVAGTECLAREAAANGVKRFVYVSTIKVNGEETRGNEKYTEANAPAPQDAYGISKWEAEQVLHRVAAQTGLEVVIVRPPLVYGPGVKGNFAQMLGVVAKRIPLPLASVLNHRDMIYVGNLASALSACATHSSAAGQTYLLSDGEAISTTDLLFQLGLAMGRPARLFSCPPALLKMAGHVTGKSGQIERLLGSLQVDSVKIRRELGWQPPYTLRQGLQETAKWYRSKYL